METLLPKHPESYLPLLKRSILLYRKSFKHIYLFALILAIITFIPRFLSIVVGQDFLLKLNLFDLHRLWLFLINLISLMLYLSMLWRIHGIIDHLHEPIKEDLLLGAKKLFIVFISAIIQGLILMAVIGIVLWSQYLMYPLLFPTTNFWETIFAATILISQFFIIVYAFTLFIFLAPLIVIENKGILSALKKTVSLVWNHWWRTFSLQLTPWISYMLLLVVIRLLFNIDFHVTLIASPDTSLWVSALQAIIFSLFIPWAAAVLLVQLKDLELRKKLVKKNG